MGKYQTSCSPNNNCRSKTEPVKPVANTRSPDNSSSSTPLLILVGLGIPFIFMVFVVYFYGIGEQPSLNPVQLATGEWAPYTGEDLPSYGVATAIVSEVMRDIGYEPHYQFMSWSVALNRVESSKTDDEIRGSFPFILNEKRKTRFYFSNAIMHYDITAFYNVLTNPNAATINSVEDLSDFEILNIDGYDYPESIRKHIADKAVTVPDIDAAIQLIANSDKQYIAIESVEVGNQLLEQRYPQLVSTISAAPLRVETPLYLLLSRNNPNNQTLKDDFNRSLKRLKHNAAFSGFQKGIKRKIDMERAIQLEPFGEQGVIHAYTDKGRGKSLILPRGSRAIVKEWDSRFFQETTDPKQSVESLVRVKLLNGPMKNREFFVDGRTVHLP